jgi:predicted MPP superfamily phosphohydrolase
MRGNPLLVMIIFSAIILIMDFYSWWGIKKIISGFQSRVQRTFAILYWIIPVFLILGLTFLLTLQTHISAGKIFPYFHLVSGAFIIFYIPKLVFIIFNLFDDVIFQMRKMITLKEQIVSKPESTGKKITRRKLLNQVGIVFAGVPFLTLIYGVAYGRFDFTIRRLILNFPHLPPAFNGIKIVQISDFHIGTFIHHPDQVQKLVQQIDQEQPDLLFFTGDFINNLSTEMDPFIDILKSLQAKFGKYSILGNHDYGEYFPWKSQKDKDENLQRLIKIQKDLGFNLLLDESRKITIGSDHFELIGIQNWGLPPFPQYGDLNKAMKDVDLNSFKILMSHDPTHWDAQVKEKTDIDLMLAGHTHGAQFGIEIPGWRWSPVTLRYKQWGGLYTEGKQNLYINTGLGSIGYPGRVGMPPEITVLELQKV